MYRDLKNKYKIINDDNMYLHYIENAVACMFEWDEKIYRPEMFDWMIRNMGSAALIKTDTSDYTPVVFTPVEHGSGRTADGWFRDCTCFDACGNCYEFLNWDENPDILVFFNTPLRIPDTFAEKYATMLTDIDLSISNNVHFSRLHPFPVARDKKSYNAVKSCLDAISNGNWDVVLMQTTLQEIMNEQEAVQVVNITDVKEQQYIQYLSHLHDAIISRLYFYLGLGTTDNGKQAQITTEELNKNDDASITQALSWYRARKQAIEAAERKGHVLAFDFSEVWKKRIERITQPVDSNRMEDEENNEGQEVEENEQEESSAGSDE